MGGSAPDVVNIFLVEDHDRVRRLLGKVIERSSGLTLAGEASTAEAALAQMGLRQPDLVLVDVSLPGMDGIELIRVLKERYPSLPTLAVSGHDESVYAAPALRAGARGYVMKGKLETVVEAIRHVWAGGIYASEAVRARLEDLR